MKIPTHDPEDKPFISPEIRNAYFVGEDSIGKSEEVYIAEGVPDVLSLLQHGYPCISPSTTSFAEKDWPKLTSLVKGRIVYLIPDNEENHAGFEGAERTRDHLEKQGIEVRTITLPRPEGVKKVDLNEFLRDHGIEAFAKLVKAAEPVCLRDVILDATSFVQVEIPQKRTFLHPWLTEASIILVTGWRGIGKTWFVLLVLDAIAKGSNFGPWKPGVSIPCLWLDGEMAAADVVERWKASAAPDGRIPSTSIRMPMQANWDLAGQISLMRFGGRT